MIQIEKLYLERASNKLNIDNNYSYLILISGLDSKYLNKLSINSFDPEILNEVTSPDLVSRRLTAAASSPDLLTPSLIVMTIDIDKDSGKDYLNISAIKNYNNDYISFLVYEENIDNLLQDKTRDVGVDGNQASRSQQASEKLSSKGEKLLDIDKKIN